MASPSLVPFFRHIFGQSCLETTRPVRQLLVYTSLLDRVIEPEVDEATKSSLSALLE